jgi:hypothetical protein
VEKIRPQALPAHSLLNPYAANGYADCFVADLAGSITHAQYVEAFYTSWLFKLERLVLRWLVAKPSTDEEARALALGNRDQFAAWSVEARAPEQLLVRDYQGKTCSWLMVEPGFENNAPVTRLYFGTGIVPRVDPHTGRRRLTFFFRALMPLHKVYARSLLSAARSRLLDGAR